jgi:hypothetical protein
MHYLQTYKARKRTYEKMIETWKKHGRNMDKNM